MQGMGYPLSHSLELCLLDVILGVCATFPYDFFFFFFFFFLCRMRNLIVLVFGHFVVICIDGREQ